MQGQAQHAYIANLPDYQNMRTQQSANIGSQLQGEVPQDVVNQILQQAAERGIMTGTPGSSNSNASMLRALGLTSIGQQQQGTENLNTAIAQTPVAELWNPMSLYVPQTLGREERASYEASRAAEFARSQASQRNPWQGGGTNWASGGMPNLRSPTAQYSTIPAFMGGGQSGGFNSPVIGGYGGGGAPATGGDWWNNQSSNTGGSNAWLGGGSQGPTQFSPGSGGSSWLGGGNQGPTQAGYSSINQPSMTDAQWEDTFWY